MQHAAKNTKTIFYPIGRAGQPWNAEEFKAWFSTQGIVKRSQKEEVLDKITMLKDNFDIEQYGQLSIDKDRYPLMSVKTRNWDMNKPNILVTGGVHGYETSGVQGALLFLRKEALKYSDKFNILVFPCVYPWGQECIQRWDVNGVDPNRSFYENSPCEPSAAVQELIKKLNQKWLQHTDLHETTNSDFTEFRPALAARDGCMLSNDQVPVNVDILDAPGGYFALDLFEKYSKDGEVSHKDFVKCLQEQEIDLKKCLPHFDAESGSNEMQNKDKFMRLIVEKLLIHFQKSNYGLKNNDLIPDGFYLVGDSENPQKAWSKAIIDNVRNITHITAPDSNGMIIGQPITQEGELCVPVHQIKLCSSLSGASYTATTEVYPDSTVPGVTDEQCNNAQVAAVVGGLEYLVANVLSKE